MTTPTTAQSTSQVAATPTGAIDNAVRWLFDRIPDKTYEARVQGTEALTRALLGMKPDSDKSLPHVAFCVDGQFFDIQIDAEDKISISHNGVSIALPFSLSALKAAAFKAHLVALRTENRFGKLTITDMDLSRLDLSDTEMGQIDFSDCVLRGVNFSGCDLQGSSFKDADLTGALFNRAELHGVDFRAAILHHVDFSAAIMHQVKLADASAKKALFVKADLSEASGARVRAWACDFSGAKLCDARFKDGDFRRSVFELAVIERTHIPTEGLTPGALTRAQRKQLHDEAATTIQALARGFIARTHKTVGWEVPILTDSNREVLGDSMDDFMFRVRVDGKMKWIKLPPTIEGGAFGAIKQVARSDDKLVVLRVMGPNFRRTPTHVQKYLDKEKIVNIVTPRMIDPIHMVAINLGKDLIDRLNESDYAFEPRHFFELAKDLEKCHGDGFVHRDIKPANLALHEGRIKLFDTDSMMDTEMLDDVAGTPGLQPTELLEGQRAASIAIKKDQHNFFMSMIVCATLRMPDAETGVFRREVVEGFVNYFVATELREELLNFMLDPIGHGLTHPLSEFLIRPRELPIGQAG